MVSIQFVSIVEVLYLATELKSSNKLLQAARLLMLRSGLWVNNISLTLGLAWYSSGENDSSVDSDKSS